MKEWWARWRYRSLFREWLKTRRTIERMRDDIRNDRICRQCGRLNLAPYPPYEAQLAEKLSRMDKGFRCYPL